MGNKVKYQGCMPANRKGAKILVIEDNDDHWVLIQTAIQQRLPEVTPIRVVSPQQALNLLEEWLTQEWDLPQLILQDLYLPTCQEGWALLKQIKAMPPVINQIPITMLSSSDDAADIIQSYAQGVSSYAVKPVGFAEWLTFFGELRAYWWETVTLPKWSFSL